MKQLDPQLVATVCAALKGKRLEKLQASIAILNESLALGGWTPRGSVKAPAGFSPGLCSANAIDGIYPYGHELKESAWDLAFCLRYGQARERTTAADVERLLQEPRVAAKLSEVPLLHKAANPNELVLAWVALCREAHAACAELTEARPLPVITAIGLSPKVTTTLKECDLDIDLPSIRMPRIDYYETQVIDKTTGEPVYDERRKMWKMQRVYFAVWADGVQHDRSRFAHSGHRYPGCHACGKPIPSGMFVPIEALDKKSGGYVSMWLGCDCAKNIFGITAFGIKK
jgi:hypothetical protein